jgi:twinkle protein
MKRGELTLMHGVMNQGKSTMLMQICLIKAVKDNYKWAFFSPEQDPPSDFFDDLVHMYIGKSTLPYYQNQMTEDEFIRGMDFIKDHFFYIFPEDDQPTPEYINSRFESVIYKHRVDGCIIDPYNQLDNDIRKTGGREDLYLSSFLSQQKRFAQKHKIFMFVVAHPKGTVKRNSNGDFETPDVYDLAGGAMWANKCDNVLCTYRPYHRSDPQNRLVTFISHKIKKQRQCGTPGEAGLLFNPSTMRYYEKTMLNPESNPLENNPSAQKPVYNDPDIFIEAQKTCPF